MEVLFPVEMPIAEREGDLLGDLGIGGVSDLGWFADSWIVLLTAGAKGEECYSEGSDSIDELSHWNIVLED